MSIHRIGGAVGSFAAALLLALLLTVIAGCGNADNNRASGTTADNATVTASLTSDPQRNRYEVAGITDPKAFDRMFAKVQTAITEDDRAAVAALALYPIRVNYPEKPPVQITDAEQFIAQYDRIITPSVRNAMRDQKVGELFVNAQGVMAGAGQMWFGASASTPQQYGIIAINP